MHPGRLRVKMIKQSPARLNDFKTDHVFMGLKSVMEDLIVKIMVHSMVHSNKLHIGAKVGNVVPHAPDK